MNDTIVVLVNGEVLANGQGSAISDQRENARVFAEGLKPILVSGQKVAVLHGNKPQIGFVLFRAEVASHVLHGIPLDVCGADTQGATGYMLSQAMMNVLLAEQLQRNVINTITQTVVDTKPQEEPALTAIGPWYDRERAEQYRSARGWVMLEDPGRGYRRAVPSLPPVEILEMESIKLMLDTGSIVIAGGGGGVPVARKGNQLQGLEAVVITEQVAGLFAKQLKARTMLMVVEKATKFIMARLSIDEKSRLTPAQLDEFLQKGKIESRTVRAQLTAASEFLHDGGELVVITTLDRLPYTLANNGGLWIGEPQVLLGSISDR